MPRRISFTVQALCGWLTTICNSVRQMHIGKFCVRIISHPTNLISLCEVKIPCKKARNFRTAPSTAQEKHFQPCIAVLFGVVRIHSTPLGCSETLNQCSLYIHFMKKLLYENSKNNKKKSIQPISNIYSGRKKNSD